MDYNGKLVELVLEGHFFPSLHSDGSWKPTLKHPSTFVWFREEVCLTFHFSDFSGRISKLKKRYWLETDDFLISAGKNSEKITESTCQLLSHILVHHWKAYHDWQFSHKRKHSVKNQHRWKQLSILIRLSLILKIFISNIGNKQKLFGWETIIHSKFKVFTISLSFCKKNSILPWKIPIAAVL